MDELIGRGLAAARELNAVPHAAECPYRSLGACDCFKSTERHVLAAALAQVVDELLSTLAIGAFEQDGYDPSSDLGFTCCSFCAAPMKGWHGSGQWASDETEHLDTCIVKRARDLQGQQAAGVEA